MTDVGEITKRGEWYTVKGQHQGRPVSADVPAHQIEGKPRKEGERIFKRAVEIVGEYERRG